MSPGCVGAGTPTVTGNAIGVVVGKSLGLSGYTTEVEWVEEVTGAGTGVELRRLSQCSLRSPTGTIQGISSGISLTVLSVSSDPYPVIFPSTGPTRVMTSAGQLCQCGFKKTVPLSGSVGLSG